MAEQRIGVGIGVIILKDNKILMGERKNSHAAGTWACPGGHLEHNESWEDCARREVLEETGLELANLRYARATNDIFEKDDKHYITIFMIGDYVGGEPQLCEPHKCAGWQWFEWDNLPETLMVSMINLQASGYSPLQ